MFSLEPGAATIDMVRQDISLPAEDIGEGDPKLFRGPAPGRRRIATSVQADKDDEFDANGCDMKRS